MTVIYASTVAEVGSVALNSGVLAGRASRDTHVVNAKRSTRVFMKHEFVRRVRPLPCGAPRIALTRSVHRVCAALTSTRMSVLTATAKVSNSLGGPA